MVLTVGEMMRLVTYDRWAPGAGTLLFVFSGHNEMAGPQKLLRLEQLSGEIQRSLRHSGHPVSVAPTPGNRGVPHMLNEVNEEP